MVCGLCGVCGVVVWCETLKKTRLDFFFKKKKTPPCVRSVIPVRGQILVSRTDDDPLTPVCGFKTSPCAPAPRAHVSTHVRVVPVHTGTF